MGCVGGEFVGGSNVVVGFLRVIDVVWSWSVSMGGVLLFFNLVG